MPLIKETEAQFVKRMIEQLYEHRAIQRGGTVTVEGFLFTMGNPYLNTANHLSPLRSVSFNDKPVFQIRPAGGFLRSDDRATEKAMLDEAFPASGVIDVFANAQASTRRHASSPRRESVSTAM